MRIVMALLVFCFCMLYHSFSLPAEQIFTQGFAHNDYWHKRPLIDALQNGFSYIEADVFLRGNKLIVAHLFPFIHRKRTLENLYLEPLLQFYASSNCTDTYHYENRTVTLLIDIKSKGSKTYYALSKILEKYRHIITEYNNGEMIQRKVTIVISGHRPFNVIKEQKIRFAFIDEDLRKTGTDSTDNLYPLASCRYSRIIKWKGKGGLDESDRLRLQQFVSSAHTAGRKVRLWASPENEKVWHELINNHVDFINTDELNHLRLFLLNQSSIANTNP